MLRTTAHTENEAARGEIRALSTEGQFEQAWSLTCQALLDEISPAALSTARNVLRTGERAGWSPTTRRSARLAVLSTYEASELADAVRLACLALGVDAQLYEAPYGQLEQELMDGAGGLARFAPTHVLIAPSTADLGLADLSADAERRVDDAVQRFTMLWELARRDHGARVVQHGFVVPNETSLGHLSWRTEQSSVSVVRELNRRLAAAASGEVLLVDCERLAARLGKCRWLDQRLWYAARRPYGPEALTLLARDTAAVIAADVGLAARCLIVDLDNTLWGGVVGEDGVDGIAIGEGPDGEAYAAFQSYLGALGKRGLLLAVASKNDLQSAQEPFKARRGMRLTLDHFALFVADWRRKPEQIAEIGATLGIGLENLVFADDNPAECAEVSSALPEVAVVRLDVPPSELVRTLASSPRFELSAISHEDLGRQRSYVGRARAAELRDGATSLEEFWRSLRMRARARGLDASTLERAAQLTHKTNQFNLTLRRHSRALIEVMASDRSAICRTLELEDRFASHGIIGLGFAIASEADPQTAEIDTLLLSCRVIGRTAELHLLADLSREAGNRGFQRLRGIYVPGPRNELVADLYPKLGFAGSEEENTWIYDLTNGPIESPYIAELP